MIRLTAAALAIVLTGLAQSPNAAYRAGGPVSSPKLTKKVEPAFPPQASAIGAEGTVLLSIVVSTGGRAENIVLVKPLGYGLDQAAIDAVKQWTFEPGRKGGMPVPVLATIEVNFRRQDTAMAAQRNAYRSASETLARKRTTEEERQAIQQMIGLANQKHPPALYSLALEYRYGKRIPLDAGLAERYMLEAAHLKYGPAQFDIASRRLPATGEPPEAVWKLLLEAAENGSEHAQQLLGSRYSTGDGVEEDQDRARHYYSLCASRGSAMCQYRLAELLFSKDGANESEKQQAIAWALLASAQGLRPAGDLDDAMKKLSDEQWKAVNALQALLKAQ